MGLGQFQTQEREFCDTLPSLCICWLSSTCIFRKTSTKATSHADIFSRWLIRLLCWSLGLSSHLSDFCWFPSLPCFPPPSADCCLLPLSVFLRQLTPSVEFFLDPSSLCPPVFFWTSCLAGDLEFKPFVWVSHQSRQRDSLTDTHTRTPNTMNGHLVSHDGKSTLKYFGCNKPSSLL